VACIASTEQFNQLLQYKYILRSVETNKYIAQHAAQFYRSSVQEKQISQLILDLILSCLTDFKIFFK